MTISSEVGAEYRSRGIISQTFDLADHSVLADLRRDAPSFRAEVEAHRAAGERRVPYGLTDAIVRVAHDGHIDGVVRAILGDSERWVMWGANIQQGTPNDAGSWHVDLESRLWPSITIAVGLEGCSQDNSTRYIPYSQKVFEAPAILADRYDDNQALNACRQANGRCREIISPQDFATGRFYAFDARGWHSGELSTSGDRTMLFLHYHQASEQRIPLMLDYQTKRWSTDAAPYVAGPDLEPTQPVTDQVRRPPSPTAERLRRLRHRLTLR